MSNGVAVALGVCINPLDSHRPDPLNNTHNYLQLPTSTEYPLFSPRQQGFAYSFPIRRVRLPADQNDILASPECRATIHFSTPIQLSPVYHLHHVGAFTCGTSGRSLRAAVVLH